MAYTKYSLTPANNNAAPPDGAPEGMLPSAVNDTMRDMMAQIRDCGDGIRGGTYTMTAPVITGGSINGAAIGASTASTGAFTTLAYSSTLTGGTGVVNLGSGQFYKDSSGNVGIGTASPTTRLHVAGGSTTEVRVTSSGDLTTGSVAIVRLGGSNSATSGYLGYGGTVSTMDVWNTLSGSITFGTANTERMRIDSSGNLLVGTTSSVGSGVFCVKAVPGTSNSIATFPSTNASYNAAVFLSNGLSQIGAIACTTTATSYVTSSDYRLKDITGNLTGYKERIMSLLPKQGTWKTDGSEFKGFVAHEFSEQYPKAVSGEKDAVDENGNPKYQGMQAGGSETIADLVALVQEQQALIENLTTRLTALEGK